MTRPVPEKLFEPVNTTRSSTATIFECMMPTEALPVDVVYVMPLRKRTCAPSAASWAVRDVALFCAESITIFTVADLFCIAQSSASTTGFAVEEPEMLKLETRIVPPCDTSLIAATSILIMTARGASAL